MKEVSNPFKQAIKKQARKCEIKLEFETDQAPLVLFSEDIQQLKYIAQIEPELGGLEVQLLTIKFMKGAVESLYNTKSRVKVWIGVEGDTMLWCFLGEFVTNSWQKSDKNKILTVECKDDLAFWLDKDMPFVSTMLNISKKEYLQRICDALGLAAKGIQSIHEGQLIMAMLSGTQVRDTLNPLVLAMNGLGRYRDSLEFKEFKIKSAPDLAIGYQDMLFDIEERTEDSFDSVNICTYLPGSNEYKELYSLEDISLPANYTNFKVGTILFDEPRLTKCISFSDEVLIRDFGIGTDKVTLYIDNPKSNSIGLDVVLYGNELNEASIDTSEDSENKVKTIKNIYLQDATSINTLDSRIYTSEQTKVKYRGNPAIEIGDTVEVEEIGNILVTYQELVYTGALSGNLKGVLIK